ncbi:ribosomal protein L1 [Wallemia mellicola]|uniref:Ribosomal protein L1 n=1 Tax=Wallemia mellicola TaxID=1708541 RepID=A0AB74KHD0_9BASI|nr:ribosomal protein L1 [Wallemia mellicola]
MKSHSNNKPVSIPIKNSLIDPRSDDLLLIVKDPKKTSVDLLDSNKIKFISEVVDLKQLKGEFKSFESQRNLFSQHKLLVDQRVLHLLPRFIGKHAFNNSNKPIPVDLESKNLKSHLESRINSVCQSIKFSTTEQSHEQQLENLNSCINYFIENIDSLENIKSINIKLSSSDSLPIYINDSLKQSTESQPAQKKSKSSSNKKSKDQIIGKKKV